MVSVIVPLALLSAPCGSVWNAQSLEPVEVPNVLKMKTAPAAESLRSVGPVMPVSPSAEAPVSALDAAPVEPSTLAKAAVEPLNVVKFFLLATPRSGSTWLSLLFRQHDETNYHGNECWSSEAMTAWCAAEWNPDTVLAEGSSLTTKLDLLFTPAKNITNGTTFVGFKWMADQGFRDPRKFEEAVAYINKNKVKVIALDRSNYLRKCFSFYDMMERDKAGINVHHYGKSLKTQGWDNKTYHMNASWTEGCIGWYSKQGDAQKKLIESVENKDDVLVLKYEDMCADVSVQLANIKAFLGLQADIEPGTTNIKKIHSGSMADMIENYDEIRPSLAATYPNLELWEGKEC